MAIAVSAIKWRRITKSIPKSRLVVQRIFDMYVSGMSQEAIAAQLTREGIPTPKGPRRLVACTWRQSSIKFLLRNEAYIGMKYDGKRRNVYVEDDTGRKVRYETLPA